MQLNMKCLPTFVNHIMNQGVSPYLLQKNLNLFFTQITQIDCSHKNETVQSESVVLIIEIGMSENVPKETAAYCLILLDCLFGYNPLTKIIRQV